MCLHRTLYLSTSLLMRKRLPQGGEEKQKIHLGSEETCIISGCL